MGRQPLNTNDYIGKRYNKLVILEYVGKRERCSGHFFKCKCDCGKEVVVRLMQMQCGKTKACGCMTGKYVRKRAGLTNIHKRLYTIWKSMRHRCCNPKCKSYVRYGGRGIYICKEWKDDFKAFCDWSLINGYSDTLTLDREDNDMGYDPINCRWVTHKKQQNNKSNNVFIIYKGIRRTAQEWSDNTGILAHTIISRYKKGWEF